jgi:Na+-driven multidrug efflux pump
MAPFIVVVLIAPGFILNLFFVEGSPYLDLNTELRVMAGVYCIIFMRQVLGGLLHGLCRPYRLFLGQVGASALTVATMIPMIVEWGVLGAVLAQFAVFTVQVSICAYYLLRSDEPTTPARGRAPVPWTGGEPA